MKTDLTPLLLPLGQPNFQSAWLSFVAFMTLLIQAVLIVGAFWVGAILLEKIIHRIADKDKERRAVMRFLGRIAKVLLIIIGVVTALGTIGVNVAAMIASLGLSGLALALALKDLLTSTVAGVVILLSRPFHEGDHVTVAGFEGKVLEIDLRYTRLQGEGKEFLVPNSTVMTSPVTVVRSSGVQPGVPEAVKEEARNPSLSSDEDKKV